MLISFLPFKIFISYKFFFQSFFFFFKFLSNGVYVQLCHMQLWSWSPPMPGRLPMACSGCELVAIYFMGLKIASLYQGTFLVSGSNCRLLGVEQDPNSIGATLNYIKWHIDEVQNNALNVAVPTLTDALYDHGGFSTSAYVHPHSQTDHHGWTEELLPTSWITNYLKASPSSDYCQCTIFLSHARIEPINAFSRTHPLSIYRNFKKKSSLDLELFFYFLFFGWKIRFRALEYPSNHYHKRSWATKIHWRKLLLTLKAHHRLSRNKWLFIRKGDWCNENVKNDRRDKLKQTDNKSSRINVKIFLKSTDSLRMSDDRTSINI